ncbi:TetR family transcriptional regulator [Rugosimonospora acidiphila]|uniref:TetR family transcriptional regulator n=1 Tax=Rugosimonospora acidiphila TaxID=556531 RepID=A0ABP9RY43_9ACTN
MSGAIEVLATSGYGSSSLAAIAGHLGISKGIISYHFAGKAELLQEVVQTVLRRAEEAMTPAVQGAPSYTEALRRYITANLAFISAARPAVLAMTEVLTNDRAMRGAFGRSQQEAVAALEALIQGGVDAGEFDRVPARAAAVALRASIDAATGLLRADLEFDVEAYGTDLIALYGRAIAKPGSAR